MARLVALVGLPASGKTVATQVFLDNGYGRVYFGDVTFDCMKERGLEINEKNERATREDLRAKHGMAVYAIKSEPKIEALLKKGNVLIESMYSWEEYIYLKEKFPQLEVVAVYAPPKLRYQRIASRKERPLNEADVRSRDIAQIEKLHQAGPIAMADWTFVNVGSSEDLISAVEGYINDKKNS